MFWLAGTRHDGILFHHRGCGVAAGSQQSPSRLSYIGTQPQGSTGERLVQFPMILPGIGQQVRMGAASQLPAQR